MEKTAKGRKSHNCIMCGSDELSLVLDLGHQPHSDYFLRQDELDDVEFFFPLRLVSCQKCGLLQIDYFVDPEYLYQGEYLYQSSTTQTGKLHYHQMAKEIVDEFGFNKDDLAIDIGSNVGVLLEGFKKSGMKVLGVDPARVAEKANEKGIETIIDFFNSETAQLIKDKYGKAKVISGTNVFAHLHDLDDAIKGAKILLDENGVITIEAPSALDLLEHLEYDTIYHQHICYLSVKPMKTFFEKHGLELFQVKHSSIHGGTLRYYVGHKGKHEVNGSIKDYLKKENDFGVYDNLRLEKFSSDVRKQKVDLIRLLLSLKERGKTIIALSAPAKGNTLLNYCNIDKTILDFATEKNPLKIGRFTPGVHIPIYDDETILKLKPDYALILAWNFSKEIMENMKEFREGGGKFIIPIPTPEII